MKDSDYVIAKVKHIVMWLCEISATKRNLLILGNTGSGKSTMAKALKELLLNNGYSATMGGISAKDLGDIYRKRLERETWDRINTELFAVLFIDDFGMEEDVISQFGNKAQPMAMLIHNRYEKNLITVITTNLTAEEMTKKYDDRIMDRLNGYARLPYNHISYRR